MISIYPVPEFEPICEDYRVWADSQKLHVYPTRVSSMPVNQICRGKQRSEEETEISGFIVFDGDGEVHFTVLTAFDIFRAEIVPKLKGVEVEFGAKKLVFTLPGPGKYVLEINGTHKPLHIFYNPIEKDRPDPGEPNLIYYEAGIHHAGIIRLKSGQNLYLAPGSHVYGCIEMEDSQDIHIYGRGILDASDMPRMGVDFSGLFTHNGIRAFECHHVKIEGIIIQDTPSFAIAAGYCKAFDIKNVKIIGEWRYNSDGIDLFNSSHMHVSDCFVRTFDDSICVKGNSCEREQPGRIFVQDILIEDCVIWNDWGRALEIGADTVGDEICAITFRNCDILHFLFIACDVQACGNAYVHDITFKDIRVGEPLDPQCEPRLTEIFIRPMCWLPNMELGRVSDISFESISYSGRTMVPNRYVGYQSEHDIKQVTLSDIQINGRRLTIDGDAISHFIINEYAADISVDGIAIKPESAIVESEKDTCSNFLIGNGAFITM